MHYKYIYAKDLIENPKEYIKPIKLFALHSRGKNECRYFQLYCGFDIETYTVPSNHNAYMYIWQLSIFGTENYAVLGRKWYEFKQVIEALKKTLSLNSKRRIIIGVANLGYEFQFLRHQYKWSKIFAKELRQPIYAIMEDIIEFRDVLQITGGNLAQLAKEYTETQKLIGDLDYSIPRNSKTKLTDEELQYCINDVVIVAEFMKYLFETYIIPQKFIPLTKTGLLRRQVKKGCSYNAKLEIFRCYPKDYSFYKKLMLYCFRGGYTHGNIIYMNMIIKELDGFDIISSYPYAMMAYNGFPNSPLLKEDISLFYERIKTHCVIFHAIFYELESTTPHTIESYSKCVEVSKNVVIDNGRIRYCDYCEVWLTELDYFLYEKYYKWSKIEIIEMYTSIKGRLPQYLLKPLWEAYEKKARLKAEKKSNTTEYALYKSYVNSAYGMTVTRLTEKEIALDDNNEWIIENNFNYEEEKRKAFLLPQWGIYVCAYSRYRLLEMLYKIQKDGKYEGIYCDTDSIKCVGDYNKLFENENKKIENTMKKVCNMYNLDFSVFHDLGSWEKEFSKVKGKFLGAKRYIITDENGNTKATIAGLPKKSFMEYCKKYNKNPYDVFNDNMMMDIEVSFKNASCYNDLPHYDIVEGEKMMELSSVGIFPIEFTMNVNDYYLNQIEILKRRYEKNESRVY